MGEWNPDLYGGLRDLLEGDAAAYDYFCGLPPLVRSALRRRTRVGSMEEMQSAAADEQEI